MGYRGRWGHGDTRADIDSAGGKRSRLGEGILGHRWTGGFRVREEHGDRGTAGTGET